MTTSVDFATGLPLLEGARIRLRQLRRSDAPDLYAIFSDPEVMRYWSRGPFTSVEEAHALLEHIEEGRRTRRLFQWGITAADADQVIGTTTIFAWERAHRRAELGFALRRSVWGQGLGSAAARLAVSFGFATLCLNRFEADVDPRNEASLRILRGLGFREEGHLRERYLVAGEAQDALLMGLLRSDWEASAGA